MLQGIHCKVMGICFGNLEKIIVEKSRNFPPSFIKFTLNLIENTFRIA